MAYANREGYECGVPRTSTEIGGVALISLPNGASFPLPNVPSWQVDSESISGGTKSHWDDRLAQKKHVGQIFKDKSNVIVLLEDSYDFRMRICPYFG